MAGPSVTHTFVPGTTAEGGQVNTNFGNLVSDLTSGNKDINIKNLTLAGKVTGNIIPTADSSQNLGAANGNWVKLHLNNGATDGGAIYFDGGVTSYIKSNAAGDHVDFGGFDTGNGPLIAPAGTGMLFYQAAAPTGWTAAAVNNFFVRSVTTATTGGTTGGTHNANINIGTHTHTISNHVHSDSHTHTGPSHTHARGSLYAQMDGLAHGSRTHIKRQAGVSWNSDYYLGATDEWKSQVQACTSGLVIDGTTAPDGTGNTGARSAANTGNPTSNPASGQTSIGSGSYKYADCVIATKD